MTVQTLKVHCTHDCGAVLDVQLPAPDEGNWDEYNRQLGQNVRATIIAHVILDCPVDFTEDGDDDD